MDNMYVIGSNGELYHWGVRGMKWGIRRYQNKDGSLTPAGRKRYAEEESKLKAREKEIKNRERVNAKSAKLASKKADLDAREAALNGDKKAKTKEEVPKQKTVKDMTDDELVQAINRARMEETYRQLHPEPKVKPKFTQRLIEESIKPAVLSSGKKALESVIDKAVSSALKDKVDPNSLEGLRKSNEKLEAQILNSLLKQGINPNIKGENLEKWRAFLGTSDKKGSSDSNKGKNDRNDKNDNDVTDAVNKEREKAKYEEYNQPYKDPKPSADNIYSGSYRNKGGSRESVNPNESREMVVYTPKNQTSGEHYMTTYSGWNDSYSTVASSNTTSAGARRAVSIIDKHGNEIFLPDDYD